MASFSPTRLKIGDVVSLSEPGFANKGPHARFVVAGKRKGLAGYRFDLAKIPGERYRYSWDYKRQPGQWWTAKELSSHYATVYRRGKWLGNITTKYW